MFIISLQIDTSDADVAPPDTWDWDALVNGGQPAKTPVFILSCVEYPVPKERQQ